jgi:hypothetical protein
MGINFQHNVLLKISGIFVSIFTVPMILMTISSIYIKGHICSGEECMGLLFLYPIFPLALIYLGIALARIKSLDGWDKLFFLTSLINALTFLFLGYYH